MEKYDNIDLYLNWRAYDANTDGRKITSVDARHTSEGNRLRFEAPLFADCTGDGWIGFWAGADFMYGRESVDEFNEGWDEFGELWSPEEPDGAVMGASVLSTAMFYKTDKYYLPYRSLYSKNINNLFMAGRCFSCSHVGLGGPRVMRTTGQMGAAVGLAASVCKKYDINPRQVYDDHLDEYMDLIRTSTEGTEEVKN